MGGVGRDVAPADHALAFGGDGLLEDRLARGARFGVRRQEHLADREPPVRREREAEASALGAKESLGELEQDASAIAGLGISAACRAMRQPPQDLEPVVDDLA